MIAINRIQNKIFFFYLFNLFIYFCDTPIHRNKSVQNHFIWDAVNYNIFLSSTIYSYLLYFESAQQLLSCLLIQDIVLLNIALVVIQHVIDHLASTVPLMSLEK